MVCFIFFCMLSTVGQNLISAASLELKDGLSSSLQERQGCLHLDEKDVFSQATFKELLMANQLSRTIQIVEIKGKEIENSGICNIQFYEKDGFFRWLSQQTAKARLSKVYDCITCAEVVELAVHTIFLKDDPSAMHSIINRVYFFPNDLEQFCRDVLSSQNRSISDRIMGICAPCGLSFYSRICNIYIHDFIDALYQFAELSWQQNRE